MQITYRKNHDPLKFCVVYVCTYTIHHTSPGPFVRSTSCSVINSSGVSSERTFASIRNTLIEKKEDDEMTFFNYAELYEVGIVVRITITKNTITILTILIYRTRRT